MAAGPPPIFPSRLGWCILTVHASKLKQIRAWQVWAGLGGKRTIELQLLEAFSRCLVERRLLSVRVAERPSRLTLQSDLEQPATFGKIFFQFGFRQGRQGAMSVRMPAHSHSRLLHAPSIFPTHVQLASK